MVCVGAAFRLADLDVELAEGLGFRYFDSLEMFVSNEGRSKVGRRAKSEERSVPRGGGGVVDCCE